jgi:glycosyltransferase involved in cell wall biosynthesis
MRLLVVTPYYPPNSKPGANRVHQLCRRLAAQGVEVHIVTPPGEGRPEVDNVYVHDASDVPQSRLQAALSRARLGRLARLMDYPDASCRWNQNALPVATEVARRMHFDVMMTSHPPLGSTLLGLRLHEITGIPWIADFRDPWVQNPFVSYESRWHYRRQRALQRRVLADASLLLMNTRDARSQLLDDVGWQWARKVDVLPNGYDIADVVDHPVRPAAFPISLVHVGQWYGRPQLDRRPPLKMRLWQCFESVGRYRICVMPGLESSAHYLAQALDRLAARGYDADNLFRVRQIGPSGLDHDQYSRWLQGQTHGHLFSVTDRVDRADALQEERSADVLLVMQMRSMVADRCPSVASKVYSVLASGRPLLGLVPHGEVREILEAAGCRHLADPADPEAIADRLEELVAEVRTAGKLGLRYDMPSDREWDALTDRLLRHLTEIGSKG